MKTKGFLDKLAGLGIAVSTHEDGLRYEPRSAVTPELLTELRARKDDVLRHLRGEEPDFPSIEIPMGDMGPDGWPTDCVEPPNCPDCDGLDFWWDVAGQPHFSRCDPPNASERLRRIIQRHKRRGHRADFTVQRGPIVGAGHPPKQAAKPPAEITWKPDGGTGCWNLEASNEYWWRQRE